MYSDFEKERQRRYNASRSPAKTRAYHKEYYVTHCEDLYQKDRKWRAAHPEQWAAYQRKYQSLHLEEHASREAVRRGNKLGVGTEFVDRQVVFERDQGLCGICQGAVDPANWHLDHIKPLSRGGEHSYKNVQVTHPMCNWRKGNKENQDDEG